ncbi:MAG: LemA family protein [Myxococcota bacterium]
MRTLGALAITSVLCVGCGFNAVVDADQDVQAAWAEVQNQYQRRADLVPNLVQTVKGAADFESETLTAVTEARSQVAGLKIDKDTINDPAALAKFEKAQSQLGGALSRLLVSVERYPQLKATQAFRDLNAQLEGTENRIAVARRRFIESVSAYNKIVLRFPSMIGAQLRGMSTRPTFEATVENAEQAPKVEF